MYWKRLYITYYVYMHVCVDDHIEVGVWIFVCKSVYGRITVCMYVCIIHNQKFNQLKQWKEIVLDSLFVSWVHFNHFQQ